nr:MAG TPA_asm: hypothetical protein [Caudoviricetes sp.]
MRSRFCFCDANVAKLNDNVQVFCNKYNLIRLDLTNINVVTC